MAGVLKLPLVIVGCGPAGLAAASVVRARDPARELVLLDAGRPLAERRRDRAADVAAGVGGAGLYSDGKFSFYPAASALWDLPDRPRLARAYAWLRGVLAAVGVAIPDFLAAGAARAPPEFKPYPSVHVDLARRERLIAQLFGPFAARAWLTSRLLDLERTGRGLRLRIARGAARVEARADAVVLAGGRFAPLQFGRYRPPLPMRFRRLELGLRLEGPAAHPFFADLRARGAALDPKLVVRDPARAVEWRTFCYCADGEVVEARCDGFAALSGRADGAATGRSNVGFNVRLLAPAPTFSLARLGATRPFRVPLREARRGHPLLAAAYGVQAADLLREGLERLAAHFPALDADAELTAAGPAIEGVGSYPRCDAALSLGGGLYVAGDASGAFRGLVAALLSGAYVGEALASR